MLKHKLLSFFYSGMVNHDKGITSDKVRRNLDGKISKAVYDMPIDPFYSESNIRYLEQKMTDYKAGRIKVYEHELREE